MPFSFLNPWFWLGALALGAPLWLHLRRRQQTNLFKFSAVRFLEDQPEPRRSPLQLRRRLLLAVRALALLLLVAAFAWPYLQVHSGAPLSESRVYILDNTLSHQAGNGFIQDRDRLVVDLGGLGPGVQVAVIELTAAPRLVVSFNEGRAAARQKVAELKPSHQRGSYLAAFRQANALLESSLTRQRRIVLLGDNQENQWTENISTPPFLGNVRLEVPNPPKRGLPNLALSEPRVQRLFAGDKALVDFSVKLTHLGPAQRAQLVVRANGQTTLNRTIELAQQPATVQLQARWEADPHARLDGEATVEGEPDALAGDNRVYFSLPPVTEGTVAVLAQSPYVRVGLSPDIMRGRWSGRPLDPARLAAEVSANRPADVLCLESDYLQSAEARKLVHQYLDSGHGVLLLVNRLSPAIEGCLRELGFEPNGVARPGREHFQFVLLNHPIFHPFLSPDFGNLQEITVSEFVRLKSTEATPLVVGQDGAGLFFQSGRFRGKLFVAAFGLDREHTSWPIHQSFIPFLDLTLQAARARDPQPTMFEPGELARVHVHQAGGAHTYVLRSGKNEIQRVTATRGQVQVRLPDEPGIYTLSAEGQDQPEQALCVNPSAKEAQLVYTSSPEALKRWRLERSVAGNAFGASALPAHREVFLQQRLWWWMLITGVLLLMLEMGMAEAQRRGDAV